MTLPPEVQSALKILHDAGFAAYGVGGGVRDLLLNKKPKDWDVTTNAKPEEIQKLFPKSFYANQFGTVTILTTSEDPSLKEIEITTYRSEKGYSDQRHPDEIAFVSNLEEDLARRDFTINAIALDEETVVDPFDGQADLAGKLVRAVGNPKERFAEDALRLLRAVRLATELNFEIEPKTLAAVTQYAPAITAVSHERVRDELIKLVKSDYPEKGMNLLKETGLLALILPEVAEGIAVGQNRHHIYTVFEHNIKSLQYAATYKYPFHVRLAALLHDIGKPRTKRFDKKINDYTFYAHDIVGSRMAEKVLKRLKFSKKMTDTITHLVRHHMFYYDVGKVTEAGARRLLRRVGKEHFDDLIKLRIAERKGSGVPKAEPYRLRHLQFMVEKAAQEPISVKELKITGRHLQELGMKAGPIFGGILNALLAEVLEDPIKNTKEYLLKRAVELKDKNPDELKKLGEVAAQEEELKREEDIKKKYRV
ncbi:MAG: HD domain-containing protein [Candidatus Andersenbacteria bacterium]|nr:HD domain-containing protein [Candidatus Andersenbacteria bacterium]